ncbi:hypothetical protein H9P43_001086 [Blastocladiella emersonii ATCC 22665]|nr:hypothetical protein H9P43_001086 [Blastocladiella emersonii ATCC 22665]
MALSGRPSRKVLWSPHGDPRVLVASHDIRLYEWDDADALFRHVAVLADPVLQNWRCIAWSPDPSTPDVVGLGLGNGKILLSRIRPGDGMMAPAAYHPHPHHHHHHHHQYQYQQPQYAPSDASAFGAYGYASSASASYAPNTYLAELAPRQPRACHALDFNSHDPALLAAGYEKTRNEHCLMVWDVETQSSHSPAHSTFPNAANDGLPPPQRASGTHDPASILGSASNYPIHYPGAAAAVAAFSAAALTHTRHLSGSERRLGLVRDNSFSKGLGSMGMGTDDLASTRVESRPIPPVVSTYQSSNAGVPMRFSGIGGAAAPSTLGNGGAGGPGTSRTPASTATPLYQFGASESVSALSWLHDHNRLIAAGMGLKWLRIFDLRAESSSGPVLAYGTRAVFGVTADPFNPRRFASYSDDCVIKVWDIRRPGEAMLTIPPAPAVSGLGLAGSTTSAAASAAAAAAAAATSSVSHILFSPSRAGLLGAVYRDQPGIKMFEIIDQPTSLSAEPTDTAVPPRTTATPLGGAAEYATPTSSSVQRAAAAGTTNAGSSSLAMQLPLDEGLCVQRTRTVGTTMAGSFDFVPTGNKSHCQVVLLARSAPLGTVGPAASAAGGTSGANGPSPPGPIGGGGGPNAMVMAGGPAAGATATAAAALAAAATEFKLELLTLHNTPQAAWNPNGSLAAAAGTTITFETPGNEDVTATMRRRAMAGYAMNAAVNQTVVADVPPLRALWTWIARMEQLTAAQRVLIGGLDFSYLGIQRILQGLTANGSRAETEKDSFTRAFTSPQRRLALSFCGWFGRDEVEGELLRLEAAGQYEKAALWAFLYGDLGRTIQSLLASKGTLVPAVLAGYIKEARPEWVHLCRSLSQELTRPELRAMFTYLSTSDWSAVMYEDLEPHEKLLVALRYFDDAQLLDYTDTAADVAVREGDLQGILFTGLSPEGVELFVRYVDNTADFQTAAVALSFAIPRRFKDPRVQVWVDEYRDFLDRQQLFHVRAHFDIAATRAAGPENADIAPQIHVRCNFCNQSIAQSVFLPGIKDRDGRRVTLQASGGVGPGGGGGGPGGPGGSAANPRLKATACPNCRKALPRCALCLLSMGTPLDSRRGGAGATLAALVGAGGSVVGGNLGAGASPRFGHGHGGHHAHLHGGHFNPLSPSPVPSPMTPSGVLGGSTNAGAVAAAAPAAGAGPGAIAGFESWFTWCQTCRHGGHAGHIMQWFAKHTRCPVADCDCRCLML